MNINNLYYLLYTFVLLKSAMRSILVKLLTLKDSLDIACDVTLHVPEGATRRAFIEAKSVAANVLWRVAIYVVTYETWDKTMEVARNVAWYGAWCEAKRGKSLEEATELACLFVMTDYDKIFSAIDNLGAKIQSKENLDWSNILRGLITFDDEALKKLDLMNRRFKFFYFLRVHELFSIFARDERLIVDFYKLVQKVGDLECYNRLFVADIPLKSIKEETNIPRDVVKIILDYSNLSIHCPDDVALVSNKIKGC
jgi:hypothetical protein